MELSVEDEGRGISEEHLHQIFDPYFTTKQKGSWLGLATAYSIIQKHGGIINAESNPEQGTVFTILLPASDKEISIEAKPEKNLHYGAERILVMDDEVEVRNVVEEMLSHLQYEAVISRDGSEAVDLFRAASSENEPFDVIILDLTVPGGWEGKKVCSSSWRLTRKSKPSLQADMLPIRSWRNTRNTDFAA